MPDVAEHNGDLYVCTANRRLTILILSQSMNRARVLTHDNNNSVLAVIGAFWHLIVAPRLTAVDNCISIAQNFKTMSARIG